MPFKDARSFSDLFENPRAHSSFNELGSAYWPMVNDDSGPVRHQRPTGNYISSFVSISGTRGHDALKADPRPEVLDYVRANMIQVDYDTIYFQIIVQNGDPETALVTAQYNQIIGSRWLAYIKTRTIPKKWIAVFEGRTVNAIGKFDRYSVEVRGETIDDARLNIYQTHDHIMNLVLIDQDQAEDKRQAKLCRAAMAHELSAKELIALPTLDQGHFDNLKIQTADTRVWLSRMTKADGAKYDNAITVERLIGGVWTEQDHYRSGRGKH